MTERMRLLVEALGAVLVIVAALLVYAPLGILVAGVILIVIANFYLGDDDADPD